ncbi:MAG: 3-methyl-2-oxobutanoate hydroxymethyltransferase [Actinomycetota bacterium]
MAFTVGDLARYKAADRKFAMLTAHDFPTARILDDAGIEVILVGDSLAQVALGYDTTLPVTMEEMLHHTRAVTRGARNALVVADMPFGSYQASVETGVQNAVRFLKEAGAHAVKFEGPNLPLAEALISAGIPVMAHLGLTPQSVHKLGGYRVQAKDEESAQRLLSDAAGLQKAGAFSLVLEAVPAGVAGKATQSLDIPTIGVGAGPHCDGQVLVLSDLLGMGPGPDPKFVRRYAGLRETIGEAVKAFKTDVESGRFPSNEESY